MAREEAAPIGGIPIPTRTEVISSELPTDAATETTLDEIMDRLGDESSPAGGSVNQRLADIETALQVIDGFANENNLLFGYNDRYVEHETDTSTPAGPTSKYLSQVPAGEVWVIQAAYGFNEDTADRVIIRIQDNAGNYVELHDETQDIAGRRISWSGEAVLKENDRVSIIFNGSVLNDDTDWGAWGYKMKV